MLTDLEGIDFLQVERGPTLMRHLDNLIFEFITSETEFLELLTYPSSSQRDQTPIQSPTLPSPRYSRMLSGIPHIEGPSPPIRDACHQDLQTFGNTFFQSTSSVCQEQEVQRTLSGTPMNSDSSSITIPLKQWKITLYGQVPISPIPKPITEYEERIIKTITNRYKTEIPLKETIHLLLYNTRVQMQETCGNHLSRYSTFYGENSASDDSSLVSITDFLCEELFGMPRILATSLFHTICSKGLPPNVSELSEQHILHLPDSLPTSLIVDVYMKHCKGKTYEERFYALFSDTEDQSNSVSLARLAHILLNVLASHGAYAFVEPCTYKCTFAIIAATRIFFDADLEGKWYLVYETTYLRRGISLLSYLWSAQGTESIIGDTGPLGYEAFYVIYCTFVKNSDNDIKGRITEALMLQYNGETYSKRLVNRLLNGQGRPLYDHYPDEAALSLVDFTIFMLAECAIDSYPAIRYFFNLADGDHDGLLSVADIKVCLIEQAEQWSCYGIDLAVDEVMSQLVDMICFVPDDYEDRDTYGESLAHHEFVSSCFSHSDNVFRNTSNTGCVTDLAFSFEQILRCAMPYNIFNAMFSVKRFIYFEQRDPYIGNLCGDVKVKRPLRIAHTMSSTWGSFCLAAYDQFMIDSE
ncbi:Ser/Thr protein phosphatase 2A, 72/130 kDa reg sub B [Giardia lamblia P15]|uniref:Ser/Thr protein phosphatase 2A, 72/130 kDa reg sub B n=1 Tax=Giardia intestinalis (strain P15) TaxID=658858 RepID=E1F4M3_GIAIA|nr:Ser/Thr protein phosphatase 2A, 72/130 kDa reg sub B [Giardia lamblia P15]